MTDGDYLILWWIGGGFLLLGLVTLLWGRREEKSYFNHIATRTQDLREYLEHWPPRPQPGALKIGGWITIALGVLMLLTGLAFWLLAGSSV